MKKSLFYISQEENINFHIYFIRWITFERYLRTFFFISIEFTLTLYEYQ